MPDAGANPTADAMLKALETLSEALVLTAANRNGWTPATAKGTFRDMKRRRNRESSHLARARTHARAKLHLVRGPEEQLEDSLARRPAQLDARVQRAVRAMHDNMQHRWTVALLARHAGMSRPAFARRFREELGSSPLRYLARRRMQRAAELLGTTDASLAQVAEWVGYDSEFAFNRAFKRHLGVAPGIFRRSAKSFTMPTLVRSRASTLGSSLMPIASVLRSAA
jgi:AraC-like DNA-binding protein